MRIVVVGGVAAGMSAAARARRLDEQAEIIVLEKGHYVSFANCGLPYYVSGEIEDAAELLVQTPESLKEALDLDVRVDHEVIALDPAERSLTVRNGDGEFSLTYDELILAPGATAIRPPLPGLDSERVRTLRTVGDAQALRESVDEGAERAVVLGAGFIGLEAAEALRASGLEVTVVELAPHVLPPLEAELAVLVRAELQRLGIEVIEGIGATRVEREGAFDTVVLSDGQKRKADLVVLSVGVRPATEIFEEAGVACARGAIIVDQHGRTNLPNVWAAGDAVASTNAITGESRPVPLAGPANRGGRLVADSIAKSGRSRAIPNPLGTAVVRVGTQTAALTGANSAMLSAAGIPFHTIHLHPKDHAGYFPGATQIHLVAHVDRQNGRLLGAQAVGAAGIDKRIDVLATAIRAEMTASDLIDLDLAYAPPYGAAKDPVNMLGMIGENLMDGTTVQWQPQQLAEAMAQNLILDVRSNEEYLTGHLPGALNVPHTSIRDQLDLIREREAGRGIRVHCASGMRSYLAERMLRAAGFEVQNLSGGMLTLKAAMEAGITPSIELVTGNDPK